MTRLILIRHGETDWNVEGRWQGHIDVPLNENGRRHARRLAVELTKAGIQAIYSSDLTRALETARPLAESLGLLIRTDRRLREINLGEWQGLLLTDIQMRHAELFRSHMADPLSVASPGGETALQVEQRAKHALDEILQMHPDETVAIVAHGFVIAVLRVRLENKRMDQVWDLVPDSAQAIVYDL